MSVVTDNHLWQDDGRARISGLLRKWLFTGRLSQEERAELAAVLPLAPPLALGVPAHKPEHYQAWYGIERRMFFRWQAHGRTAPTGPDLPPFDAPSLLPAWYDRMKALGLFKHRMPRDLLSRIESLPPSAAVAPPAHDSPPPVAPQVPASPGAGPAAPASPKVPSSFTAPPSAESGIRYEIEQQEQRVRALRLARDEAYINNNKPQGDAYARQYAEEMDSFTVWKARAVKQAEQEGLLVWRSDVEADFGSRLPALVTGGMFLFDRIAAKLEAAATHAAKRALWRAAWIDHCRKLAESKFAPPFNLEALAS